MRRLAQHFPRRPSQGEFLPNIVIGQIGQVIVLLRLTVLSVVD